MKGKRYLLYGATIFAVVLLILRADAGIVTAENALALCAKTVIPTLFPFFVLSTFMVEIGFVQAAGTLLAPISKRLFHVSGSGAVVFFMGLLCGYPTGAKMVAELYQTGNISKNEARRLLPFCNNAGPLFVIGAVGAGMLNSVPLGVFLYIIHIASAVLVGVFFSFFSKQEQAKKLHKVTVIRLGKAVSASVYQGVQTVLVVCGFVVLFSVMRSYVTPVAYLFLGKNATFPLSLIEVTTGAKEIISAGGLSKSMLVMLSGAVGFGGICVLLQVCSVLANTDLGIATYGCGKVMQMVISMLLTAWLL